MTELQQKITTEIFWCLEGKIKNEHLTTTDGQTIKIRKEKDYEGSGIWLCVPATNSTGEVASISVVSKLDSHQKSYCIGRITQVTKRGAILVKVSNSCKITFISTTILNVNGVYRIEFEFVSGQLHATAVTRLDSVISSKKTEASPISTAPTEQKKIVTSTKLTIEHSWKEKLEPLILEQIPGVQLSNFNTFKNILEWEGEVNNKKYRIQGNVGSTELAIHEFAVTNREPIMEPGDSEVDVLRVTPLGAARSIGASCFRVEIGGYEIVLDAGTRPKGNNPLPAFELLKNPNLILITHAHSDHIGALPVLHRMFKATPMICTPGTRLIAQVMLENCLKVNLANEDFEPLFEEQDLQQTLLHLETQAIGVEFQPLPGLTVKFINAGHIVGAACIYLKYGNRSLLYTGDYNVANSRTTVGLKLSDLPTADILLTEATYGAAVHPNRKQQETELIQAVLNVIAKGGNVLIPAFALGRAQEIIIALKTSALFSNKDIPIYVDGLVRKVTDVFNDNLELLPETISNLASISRIPPFCDGKKVIFITDSRERPFAMAKPSVIIASSGMLSGGASVYYAKVLLERKNAAIFISGYTDEESPGRLLQNMQPGEIVTIDGQDYTVRADIRKFNLSAHTDRIGIGQVIAKVQPRHLILIHGSPDNLHDLAKTDLQKNYIIHIPHCGEVIEYGVFPDFVSQKKQVELENPKEIELEIVAERDGAWIRVPQEVVDTDPRWEWLSQMGIVRAKWHQSTLIIKAITPQHIAKQSAMVSPVNCCAKCQFFDERLCSMPESIFYNRQVDPQGVCPEFIKNE
ncbi:MAG: MBL fold metallo-hydrolase [Calothrix sp. C42_A2020_038]|nr:MBL fold metallo-hydrolase [Calothrix sp. C42_A2020_038]